MTSVWLEEWSMAFHQHPKSFVLKSMMLVLRVSFSFSPSLSFCSPAAIFRFSNMLSHLALFLLTCSCKLYPNFLNMVCLTYISYLFSSALENSSAQLQVCLSLTDHLIICMFPNCKNQDEILEWANWRKSRLSSTHQKKHQLIRDFVLQDTGWKNVTIKKEILFYCAYKCFKAKDWLWIDEKTDFLLSHSIGETSMWGCCIVTIVVNHSVVGNRSEYLTKQAYLFLATPSSSGDSSVVCINIAVHKSLSITCLFGMRGTYLFFQTTITHE